MNVMYNWGLYIYCSSQCDVLREEFRGYSVTIRHFEDLPLPSAYKVLRRSDLFSTLIVDARQLKIVSFFLLLFVLLLFGE